jgi:hypothetical protein
MVSGIMVPNLLLVYEMDEPQRTLRAKGICLESEALHLLPSIGMVVCSTHKVWFSPRMRHSPSPQLLCFPSALELTVPLPDRRQSPWLSRTRLEHRTAPRPVKSRGLPKISETSKYISLCHRHSVHGSDVHSCLHTPAAITISPSHHHTMTAQHRSRPTHPRYTPLRPTMARISKSRHYPSPLSLRPTVTIPRPSPNPSPSLRYTQPC